MFPKIVGFPPKSSILIGCSIIINHPFRGKIPYFWSSTQIGRIMGFLHISIRARRGSRPWQSGHPDHHSPHQMQWASRHLSGGVDFFSKTEVREVRGSKPWGSKPKVGIFPKREGMDSPKMGWLKIMPKTLFFNGWFEGKNPLCFGNTQSGRISERSDIPRTKTAFFRKKTTTQRFLLHVHSLFPCALTLLEVLLGLLIFAVRTIVACCGSRSLLHSFQGSWDGFARLQRACVLSSCSFLQAQIWICSFLQSILFWFATTTHSYLDLIARLSQPASKWIQKITESAVSEEM